jgi:c-di-GMP-related signal transduction protein
LTVPCFGIDALCDGRPAFINCTRDVLLNDLVTLLPPPLAVVEILESVEVDDVIVSACRRLKDAGYLIALDDFAPDDRREPLSTVADIIKVDLRATTRPQRIDLIRRFGTPHCRMLAEKVEAQEEFREALRDGFHYFQGFFFRKPELMTAREIPANQLNYLRMLAMVASPELDIKEIERAIKGEVSVCYRLLRYLNSPVFAFHSEIHSVRHALGMLGEREIRRWVRLVATLGAGQGKSSELVFSASSGPAFANCSRRASAPENRICSSWASCPSWTSSCRSRWLAFSKACPSTTKAKRRYSAADVCIPSTC